MQGRQLRLKEAYEQAVQERKDKDGHMVDINCDPDKIKHLKKVFERKNNDDQTVNKEELHFDPEKMKQMKQVFENSTTNFRLSNHERQEELSVLERGQFFCQMHETVEFYFIFEDKCS